jgi:hypothetical protein
MGGFQSIPDEIARRMGETQAAAQEKMMRRQANMQMAMQQRLMAIQLGRARDLVMFQGAFLTIAIPALLAGAVRGKNPSTAAPILPLLFVFAYQLDLAYGTKLTRIRAEAEHILRSEPHLVQIPKGVPTITEIDTAVALQMAVEAEHKLAEEREGPRA